MGEVWRARRIDGSLDRVVALKLPRADFITGGIRQRLARERDILASLTHPHIAQLYDAGVTAQGQPWLALELIEGLPIDQHCRAGALGIEARVVLFLQIVEAVRFAHNRLIVHRDLKPSNILVTHDSQVKLLDFGIAKLLDEQGGGNASALTRLAGHAMTPEYAAPEQIAGEAVSVATDVFSLGVVLFELLAGQRPFGRVRDDEAPLASTRIMPEHAAACGAADVRGWRKALAGDLDAILARCLMPAPAARYESVEQLAEDLRRHLRHEPIRARRVTRVERVSKFVRRNRVPVAMGSALAIATIAGVAGVVWQGQRAERAAIEAIGARTQAEGSRQRSEDLIGFMLGDLHLKLREIGRLDVLDSVTDRSMRYFESLGDAPVSDKELSARSRMLQLIAEVRFLRGDPEGARPPLLAAVDIDRRLLDLRPDDVDRATNLCKSATWLAYHFYNLMQYPVALERYETAHATCKRAHSLKADVTRIAHLSSADGNVAMVLQEMGRNEEAIARARTALQSKAWLEQNAPDDVEVQIGLAEPLLIIAFAHKALRQNEQAIAAGGERTAFLGALSRRMPQNMLVKELYAGSIWFEFQMRSRVAHLEGWDASARELQRLGEELVQHDPANQDWVDLAQRGPMVRQWQYEMEGDAVRAYEATQAVWKVGEPRLAVGATRPPWRNANIAFDAANLAYIALSLGKVAEADEYLRRAGGLPDLSETASTAVAGMSLEYAIVRMEVDRRLGKTTDPALVEGIERYIDDPKVADSGQKLRYAVMRGAPPDSVPLTLPTCAYDHRRLLAYFARNRLPVPRDRACPAVKVS